MRNRKVTQLFAGLMVTALVLTGGVVPPTTALAATKTVTIRTQKELKAALKDPKVKSIVIKTAKGVTFKIKDGDYSDKKLVIASPESTVKNYASFGKIEIRDGNAVYDRGEGNQIVVKDKNDLKLVAGKRATDVNITVTSQSGKVEVINNAKDATIVTAANASIVLNQSASLTVAEGTKLEKLEIKADANITVAKGAEVQNVAVSGTAQSVALTVDGTLANVSIDSKAAVKVGGSTTTAVAIKNNAEGATIESAVKTDITLNANASISLEKGAEGSAVKSEKAEIKPTVENKTADKVTVTDATGKDTTVDAGKTSTSGSGTTGGTTGGGSSSGGSSSGGSSSGGSSSGGSSSGGSSSGETTADKFAYASNDYVGQALEVENGCSEADVIKQLPAEIKIYDADKKNTAAAAVSWGAISYDASTAGTYEFTGECKLPDKWTGEIGKLVATVTVKEKETETEDTTVEIKSFEKLADVDGGTYGDATDAENLNLPAEVAATDTKNGSQQVKVTWTAPEGYGKDADADTYVFTATLTDSEGVNLAEGVALPTVNVVIGKAKNDTACTGLTVDTAQTTADSITLNAVTVDDKTVEYACAETNDASSVGNWQTETTFTGLTAGTAYYFFARVQEDKNYKAGTASSGVSAATSKISEAKITAMTDEVCALYAKEDPVWEGAPETAKAYGKTEFEADGTQIKVTGTLNYVVGFVGFNTAKEEEQQGHYLTFQFTAPEDMTNDVTVETGTKTFGVDAFDQVNSNQIFSIIYRINAVEGKPSSDKLTITIDWDGKEEKTYAPTTYTLDISELTLADKGTD